MNSRPFTLSVAAALWFAHPAHPAEPATSTAIQPEEQALYRFDWDRIYRSANSRKAHLDSLESVLGRLAAFGSDSTATASTLATWLPLHDQMLRLLRRELIYLRLRYSVDRTRSASLDSLNNWVATVNERLAPLDATLRRLDDSTLARLERDQPRLRSYHFYLQGKRPTQPRRLSVEERKLLARLEPLATSWVGEHYNALPRAPSFRENELEVAFGLRHLTRAQNEVARIRGYGGAAEAAYRSNFLELADVESLVVRVARFRNFHERYERARIERLRRLTGRDTLDYYRDYLANAPGTPDPRLAIGEATKVILNAMRPLGKSYQRVLGALLDPRNGRLDIVPGGNRVTGGFALGFPGAATSMFYMQAYTGTFANLTVLTHEAGHAVQFELMAHQGTLPVYATGPDYLSESYAQFNELLMIDHLRHAAPDPELRLFYTEQFLQRTLHDIFAQARAVAFENAMYDSSGAGASLSPELLNRMMREIGARYSMWFGGQDETMRDWVQIPHYSRNPFYRAHYLYGRLLALRYLELFKRDAQAFVPRYLSLVSAGYSAPPEELLHQHLGIDLRSDDVIRLALRLVEREVEGYEALSKGRKQGRRAGTPER